MAGELTRGRASHLASWYPEGWAPYHGDRVVALELLYVITLHDWPDLVSDPARVAALAAPVTRPRSTQRTPRWTGMPACWPATARRAVW